jgi:hypothetical protein
MSQIWNIFRKDIRYHWKEIALSLAILVAFAWFEIRSWSDGDSAATGIAAVGFGFLATRFLSGLVNVLVPISWMFLIVRLVHGEALVGDRQFWVTRPYDWKQLIAAKISFVLIFINLPLLILDIFLLARAGFHPTAYVPGLLWMQLMWILTVFLVTAVLASVTATIAQMLLALLLAVLYLIGMSALPELVPNANFAGVSDNWAGFLFVATSVAVILLQYSRRKTRLARWLIVAFCALLTLVTVIVPYGRLLARNYPLSPTGARPKFSLQAPQEGEGSSYPSNQGTVLISLPLDISGIAKDSLVELNGMIVTLMGSSGFRWDSGWRGHSELLFTDSKSTNIYFELKQKAYDQLKSSPVNAHLVLAFTSYEDKNQKPFVIPSGEFALSDVGLCSSQSWYFGSLRCLAPLRRPRFLLVSTEATASTCPLLNGQSPPIPRDVARAWVQGGSEPADMGISPIHEVNLQVGLSNPDHRSPLGLCPGTPVVLSNPEPVGPSRVELEFNNLNLEDYRQGRGPARGAGRVILRGQ